MNVCVLVLAAGQSRRFGADKRSAILPGGRSVLDTLLDQITASGLPALVCIRQSDTTLARHLEQRHIPYYRCSRAEEGMGGTLAEGAAQLAAYDGALIALGDMPWIKAATYKAIADVLRCDTICVPTHGDTPGHPVGFGKQYFAELTALEADSGARSLLEKHANRIKTLALNDAAIHRDIDTVADLNSNNQASAGIIKHFVMP